MVQRARLEDPDDDGLSPLARSLRSAQPWLAGTGQLTGGALLGWLVGSWVDGKMGWKVPWGLLVGMTVGISVGMFAFLRGVLALGKKKP